MICPCLKITTGKKCTQPCFKNLPVCWAHAQNMEENKIRSIDEWNDHALEVREKKGLYAPNASPVKKRKSPKKAKSASKKAKSPSKSKKAKSPSKSKKAKSASRSPMASARKSPVMSPQLIKKIDNALKSLSPRK